MENISIPQEKLYIPVGVKISSWLFLFAGILFAGISFSIFTEPFSPSLNFWEVSFSVFLVAITVISFLLAFFLRKMMKKTFRILLWFFVLLLLIFGSLFPVGWGWYLPVGCLFLIFWAIVGGYLYAIKKYFVN